MLDTATTVTLTVTDGTATSPGDYSATGATLTIPAGRTSATANVYITPVNDTLDEDPDETVTVRATTTSGLVLSGPDLLPDDSFTVTIEDDDGPPTGIDLRGFPDASQRERGSRIGGRDGQVYRWWSPNRQRHHRGSVGSR